MKMHDKVSLSGKMFVRAVLIAFIGLSLAACSATGTASRPEKGAAHGAAIEGPEESALRTLIDRENPLHGTLLSAAGGALTGETVSRYMDRQKNDLQAALSPEISSGQASVQKLPDNAVEVTMTHRSAFAPNSAVINQNFVPTLQKVANVVKTYGKSTVAVIGAPDALAPGAAPPEDQAALADQRAETVREMLIAMGVKPALVIASGNPQAAGSTEVIIQPLVSKS